MADQRGAIALAAELDRLAAAHVDVALLAANAPHVVFPQLQQRCASPLISLVDATCAAARRAGLKRVGLLGPRYTLEARFYPDVFTAAGIDIVVPGSTQRSQLHQLYMEELVQGVVRPATRRLVLAIIDDLHRRESVDGIILGGTELSLLIEDDSVPGMPVLDTTRLHADAAIDALMG